MVVCPGSARITATATPTGSARSSARKAVDTVPKIAGKAPKTSGVAFGFQSRPTRNPNPNCRIAGMAPCRRMSVIRTSTAGAKLAITPVTVRKRSGGRLAMPASAAWVVTAVVTGARLPQFGRRGVAVEAVADAAHGHDLERRDVREFLAQPPYVHVNCFAI